MEPLEFSVYQKGEIWLFRLQRSDIIGAIAETSANSQIIVKPAIEILGYHSPVSLARVADDPAKVFNYEGFSREVVLSKVTLAIKCGPKWQKFFQDRFGVNCLE